jgi:hypothetical protein
MVPAGEFYTEVEKYLQDRGHRVLSYNVVKTMMKDEGYEYERHIFFTGNNAIACIVGLKRKKTMENNPVSPVSPVRLLSSDSTYENQGESADIPDRADRDLKTNDQNQENLADGVKEYSKSTKVLSEHLQKWASLCEHLKVSPVNNAFDIEEKFGLEFINKLRQEGKIMELPFGTYRLL